MANYYKLIYDTNKLESEAERTIKLEYILKNTTSNIRNICKTNEYDIKSTAIGYLIEYIRDQLIDIALFFVKPDIQNKYNIKLWDNKTWVENLFKDLSHFRIPDILYWNFLNVPYMYKNSDDILKFRESYESIIDSLTSIWNEKNYFTEKEYLYMTKLNYQIYPLSYHNISNKILLAKYCKLIRKICPFINYTNPNLNKIKNEFNNKLKNENFKLKICFISDSFTRDTSVLRDRMGIIKNIDRKLFDVYVATSIDVQKSSPIAYKFYNDMLGEGKHIKLDADSISNSRDILIKEGFEIIIYPDIGMKPFQTTLAFSRLAPIQINTWGHSDTCGIDTIDYYVSSKFFELENVDIVQSHYSEKIVLLDSFGSYYYNPIKQFINNNYKFKDRETLGFTASHNIYWCLQTFFKLNFEYIEMMAKIVKDDDNAKILLSNIIPYSTKQINKIITEIGRDKVIFYPALDKTIYYNLLKVSDIVLDPYPFGGCNTSLEAFAFGVPVITLPSNFINGRFTYGFYKKMDIMDCIAKDKNDYIQLAINMINNKNDRDNISNKIINKIDLLFEEKESISDWNNTLLDMAKSLSL